MNQGICLLSVACMKAEPNYQSELVNQMIFGDLYEVVRTSKEWTLVRLVHDDYQGWINMNQVTWVPDENFLQLKTAPVAIAADLIQVVEDITLKTSYPIGAGSYLYNYGKGEFAIAGKTFRYFGKVVENFLTHPQRLCDYALMFLNSPYLWGGRSPFGIDCSGFMQLVLKMGGIFIPRDTNMQVNIGETIELINEAIPGDLLFFGEHDKPITHVGMLLADGLIIHAFGKVRVDLVDHNGIFNREQKRYTHSLRTIKRLAPPK
ncbi:MAG TPA: C40 family peptidase [Bacteroidales bacterium]|nr:C40 family peptidase [Bacteroidales bacterium]